MSLVDIGIWHVHGSWTTSFVAGRHRYLVPVTPDRGPRGRGRAQTWDWPSSVVEVDASEAAEVPLDLVVLQRPEELRWCVEWFGRRPGVDVAAVYLEHNTPRGDVAAMRHPVADRPELTLVHVTHFNRLFWDAGRTPSVVIEHGVADPGRRFTPERAAAGVVVNEPGRRGRVVGTDLLPAIADQVPVDLFGMGSAEVARRHPLLHPVGAPSQAVLHRELPRRGAYLHTCRWTSLGLALVEAMLLGMPVAALSTTEVAEVVPADAGVVSNDLDRLLGGLVGLVEDPDRARRAGEVAREAALARFGLGRFLDDWDVVLEDARARQRRRARRARRARSVPSPVG